MFARLFRENEQTKISNSYNHARRVLPIFMDTTSDALNSMVNAYNNILENDKIFKNQSIDKLKLMITQMYDEKFLIVENEKHCFCIPDETKATLDLNFYRNTIDEISNDMRGEFRLFQKLNLIVEMQKLKDCLDVVGSNLFILKNLYQRIENYHTLKQNELAEEKFSAPSFYFLTQSIKT